MAKAKALDFPESWLSDKMCRAECGYLPPSPGGSENLGRLNIVFEVKVPTVLDRLPRLASKAFSSFNRL